MELQSTHLARAGGGLLLVMLLIFAGVAEAAHTLRFGSTDPDNKTDPYAIAAHDFFDALEKAAPGEFKAQFFPNHQLGNEIAMLQDMQLGTLDGGVITCTQIGSLVPAFQLNDLPFLYKDNRQAHAVLDGDVGKKLIADLAAKGIVGLGFAEGGFRNVINNVRPVHTPADLKGIKLRVQPSDLFIAAFRALGANPVPMAWSDVFTAVQQGTVDGLEIPLAVIYANKYPEVTKYLSLTRHAYNAIAVLVSKQYFDRLSPPLQQAMRTAAKQAIEHQRKTVEADNKTVLDKIRKAGMKVNKIDDIGAFRDKVKPVYQQYRDKIGPALLDEALKQVAG